MDADRGLTARKLVSVTASDRQPLDRVDVHVLDGLFLLTVGLIRGNPEGWSSGVIIGALVGAAVGWPS